MATESAHDASGGAATELREEIAIVGMAGRFPGATNVQTLWENLCNGVESISFFSREEVLSCGVDASLLDDPAFVNASGVMDGADCFDAAFFGLDPREAELMDPQHRVFLECAWETLEHAGFDPDVHPGVVGVFGGVGPNTYFRHHLAARTDVLELMGPYQTMIGNEGHFLATRVSYKLNLKGPSINVQTACSTSGVAIHLACQSLLAGECDLALAGGARIRVPLYGGYVYQEDGIPSPDGHCRAFDRRARGTVYGSGVALVVLQRLSDAVRAGAHIHAVIKGSAVNNDGGTKVGYTAPGLEGQVAAISEALAVADVPADTIGYVEAHGTGTTIGDPIEVAALTKAFFQTTDKTGFCALGSVKTNLGHLDAAAGVTGLIKAALALEHGLIPPSLHFEEPNPQIDFAHSPFYVNTALAEWRAGATPRRAGISSFGLGGTNAHIVLEEAPPVEASGASRTRQFVVLSAKTESALETATDNLVAHLRANPSLDLADVAFTLHLGRKAFGHRRIAVCRDGRDAIDALKRRDPKKVIAGRHDGHDRTVVFMFPGGGAQYVNMGRDLYEEESTYRREVDECLELLERDVSVGLRRVLFPTGDFVPEATKRIQQPSTALPLLFTVEYATAKLLMSWGVQPTAMIGHSMGEYAAACLADVLTLEDALRLVTHRGQLFDTLPAGAMLSVALAEETVRALLMLTEDVSIAATNGPALCVVSGSAAGIQAMETVLTDREVDHRRVPISVAAHSSHVDPVLEAFDQFMRGIRLREPRIPYVSNVTGTWMTATDATDPAYWVKHLRRTVRFGDGLTALSRDEDRVLVETGPGQTLGTFARHHPDASASAIVSTLRHPRERTSDVAFLLEGVGRLWLSGGNVDWTAFYAPERRQRVALPTYPLQRRRHWVEARKAAIESGGNVHEFTRATI